MMLSQRARGAGHALTHTHTRKNCVPPPHIGAHKGLVVYKNVLHTLSDIQEGEGLGLVGREGQVHTIKGLMSEYHTGGHKEARGKGRKCYTMGEGATGRGKCYNHGKGAGLGRQGRASLASNHVRFTKAKSRVVRHGKATCPSPPMACCHKAGTASSAGPVSVCQGVTLGLRHIGRKAGYSSLQG